MHPLSDLGRVTIIVTWIATGLAFLSVMAVVAYFLIEKKKPRWEDWVHFLAFAIGILLVGQNTWAIVVEGEGEKQSTLSNHQVDTIAKVEYLPSIIVVLKPNSTLVTSVQRSPMDLSQCTRSTISLFVSTQNLSRF
jgi:hypothetical protein